MCVCVYEGARGWVSVWACGRVGMCECGCMCVGVYGCVCVCVLTVCSVIF